MDKPVHSISLIWFLAISYLLSAILLSDCKFENYLYLKIIHTHTNPRLKWIELGFQREGKLIVAK